MRLSILEGASRASIAQYTVPVVGLELGQTEVTVIGILMISLLIMGSGFFFFVVRDCIVLSPGSPGRRDG